jgi:hypothetical protein
VQIVHHHLVSVSRMIRPTVRGYYKFDHQQSYETTQTAERKLGGRRSFFSSSQPSEIWLYVARCRQTVWKAEGRALCLHQSEHTFKAAQKSLEYRGLTLFFGPVWLRLPHWDSSTTLSLFTQATSCKTLRSYTASVNAWLFWLPSRARRFAVLFYNCQLELYRYIL